MTSRQSLVVDERIRLQARQMLRDALEPYRQLSYEHLLARLNHLCEEQRRSPDGQTFFVCTQVLQASSLSCTLEVRGSIQWQQGEDLVPLDLREGLAITADNQRFPL